MWVHLYLLKGLCKIIVKNIHTCMWKVAASIRRAPPNQKQHATDKKKTLQCRPPECKREERPSFPGYWMKASINQYALGGWKKTSIICMQIAPCGILEGWRFPQRAAAPPWPSWPCSSCKWSAAPHAAASTSCPSSGATSTAAKSDHAAPPSFAPCSWKSFSPARSAFWSRLWRRRQQRAPLVRTGALFRQPQRQLLGKTCDAPLRLCMLQWNGLLTFLLF